MSDDPDDGPDADAVPHEAPVAGADGCKAGWVVVTLDDHVGPDGTRRYPTLTVVPSLDDLVADVASGTLSALAVDMPIGLSSREPRACDSRPGGCSAPPRSVFPAPGAGRARRPHLRRGAGPVPRREPGAGCWRRRGTSSPR